MKRVFSSHINQIGYEPESKTLMVEYSNGKMAHFHDVPPDIANDVVNAPSVGKAIHENIRGKYEHSYPGDEDGA